MTTPADDITVAQLRNRLEATGNMVANAIRDAYARGLAEGLRQARAERVDDDTDDVTQRRPTVV